MSCSRIGMDCYRAEMCWFHARGYNVLTKKSVQGTRIMTRELVAVEEEGDNARLSEGRR